MSVIWIALVPLLLAATAPVKSLPPLVSVIGPAPPLNVAVPADAACVIAPDCVMPMAVTVSVPEPTFEAANWMALVSVIATLFAPEFVTATVPWKSLSASVSVITPAAASSTVAPVTVTPAVSCVMPTAVTVKFPLAEMPPSWIAVASCRAIAAPPVFVADTAPPKSLVDVVKVIAPVPESSTTAPPVVIPAAVCVMFPDAFTVSVPVPVLTRPSWIAVASVISVVAAPVLEMLTAPVKSFPASASDTLPPLPVIEASPAVIVPPVWLMPVPASVSELAFVSTLPVIVSRPPTVVIEPLPSTATGPLTVSPPAASTSVKEPPSIVTAPTVPMALVVLERSRYELRSAVSVAAVIDVPAVWPKPPSVSLAPMTTVPLAATIVPRKLPQPPSSTWTAVAEALVVTSDPAMSITPPLPSMRIVAAVAFTVEPEAWVTSMPESDTSPVAVMFWPARASTPVVEIV